MTPKIYTPLKWGALLGGPLAIFETFAYLSTLRALNRSDFLFAECLIPILEIAVSFAAGLLAARAAGEARSGLFAGLMVGVIVAVVNLLTILLTPMLSMQQELLDIPALDANQILAGVIQGLVVTIVLGAWAGWLGGRLGQTINSAPPRQ